MKTTHTPGPFHVGMKPGPMVYGPQGEQIADLTHAFIEDESKANAAFIVRACNSHYELLAALEAMTKACMDNQDFRHRNGVVLFNAHAAIAKAKGE
jgi:hypothetical protein